MPNKKKSKSYEVRDSDHPVLSFVPSGGIISLLGCLDAKFYGYPTERVTRVLAEIKWEGESFKEVITLAQYHYLVDQIDYLDQNEHKL